MGQRDPGRRVGCELCMQDGGLLVHRGVKLRVIRATEPEHPAFYRVIWNDHVAEWTDLPPADRSHIMQAVAKVETVLREHLQPTKVNLASLGNVVPHLHWHVIARFDWDGRWPAPVWAPLRESVPDAEARLAVPLSALDRLVAEAVRELDLTTSL
jgi:diadenosine tetraphosphate (Ap4A) HIT family hydrolase